MNFQGPKNSWTSSSATGGIDLLKFSGRTNWSSEKNALSRLVDAKKAAGETILDFTESNPAKCGFNYLNNDVGNGRDRSLLVPFNNPANLQYDPHPQGLLEARKAIVGYYAAKGITVSPEQIFLTASTSEAYAFLFKLLCDPGDHVLVPCPSYPLFDYLTVLENVIPSHYSLIYDRQWIMNPSALAEAPPHTKAIIVVNPNNPTGNYVNEYDTLAGLCRSKDIAILSDEVFFDFSFAAKAYHKSFAGDSRALTFTLSGISKILGLPQMKLSWIVVSGPDVLREKAISRLQVIADTYLSVNTPSQNALPSWMENVERISGEIRGRVTSNRKLLENTISVALGARRAVPLQLLSAEGGWYAVLRLPEGIEDETFALDTLRNKNILVHPGYFFDFEDGLYVVLSLLTPPGVFMEGAGRLCA